MISHRGATDRAALDPNRGVRIASSMSQMADRFAPIDASLVQGEGDDSFTLIWSRRNGD
jgi:uncharacterized protein (DUF736 family)